MASQRNKKIAAEASDIHAVMLRTNRYEDVADPRVDLILHETGAQEVYNRRIVHFRQLDEVIHLVGNGYHRFNARAASLGYVGPLAVAVLENELNRSNAARTALHSPWQVRFGFVWTPYILERQKKQQKQMQQCGGKDADAYVPLVIAGVAQS